MKPITTLAIDTSCDETSVSVVKGTAVLSNVLPSQIEFHRKYGGVMPSVAKLAHMERIDNVVIEALKKAKVTFDDIDTISVTVGPGLAIALEVGINKAKELAEKYNKPLIAVNHMEGHLLSAFALPSPSPLPEVEGYPTLGMLVSGGHTEILLVKDFGNYKKIGETLDDSCGEAYDKCGRMLGLGYPAGPVISKFAKEQRKNMILGVANINNSVHVWAKNKKTKAHYSLPVAMARSNDLNFSYSGLKTAFKQLVTNINGDNVTYEDQLSGSINLNKEQIMDLCVIFEHAALTQLAIKLEKAIKQNNPKEVWLGGGVVASARLRFIVREITNKYNIKLRFPNNKKLFGDNAAMIGVASNIKVSKLNSLEHNPSKGIYLKDFDLVDRDPNLSL